MKSRPYPTQEPIPTTAAEPAVAYQRTDPATYRPRAVSGYDEEGSETDAALETYMNTGPGEMGDGFRPFTMAELNRWMDEVEAEDDEEATPHEEVMREMHKLILSYED